VLAAGGRKVELGRRLFFDPAVSRTGRVSCSSCHDPEHGFSDPRVLSEDEHGPSRRHSQPLLDLGATQPLHWDGEFGTLREILNVRLLPAAEALALARSLQARRLKVAEERGRVEVSPTHGFYGLSRSPDVLRPRDLPEALLPDDGLSVAARLMADGRYRRGFVSAYGTSEVTNARVVEALEAYVLSLRSGTSPFDRYRAGDPSALTDTQRVGLSLFLNEAGCAACHTVGESATFTDGLLHNTGVAFHARAGTFEPDIDLSLLFDFKDGGAGEVTLLREHLAKFKTPSLRDVARRPPYMHDGSLATLEDVVRFYNRGGTPNRGLDPGIRPLRLTGWEISCLVAFLEALTSDERPGLGPLPPGRRRAMVFVAEDGLPLGGLAVKVVPAGDRLAGARPDEPAREYRTDPKGRFSFEFPRWTHVRLVSRSHEILRGRLIPDFVTTLDAPAAPRE
jgi:cytochrome c peroxidase